MGEFYNISSQCDNGSFVLSNVKQIDFSSKADEPSIKMVLSGIENYSVNGKKYKLKSDRFLVVNNQSDVNVIIDDKKGVKGACLFPKKTLFNDVFRQHRNSCEALLNDPFKIEKADLLEKAFSFRENRTGAFLENNIQFIIDNHRQEKELNFNAFYLKLVECMIFDQLELEGKLKNLSSTRKSTKEELYRRVSNAKIYIDDNYTERINLDVLAQNAYLSKYHFLRSFKALYKLSPYQYILSLRLEKARELLSMDYSFAEVSNLIGFSDEKNLRKAIKRLNAA